MLLSEHVTTNRGKTNTADVTNFADETHSEETNSADETNSANETNPEETNSADDLNSVESHPANEYIHIWIKVRTNS